jgi:ABC-type transporter Mla maintaining outer membrane lipid asymmetry permease subunit MlaE
MLASIAWFAVCVWLGGVFATGQLFDIPDPVAVMTVSEFDISRSLFWTKACVYSALVSLTVVALGLATKSTAHQVNMHTTKSIIYATLSIALAELIIILT